MILNRLVVLTAVTILSLCIRVAGGGPDHSLSSRPDAHDCCIQAESFPLKDRDLRVIQADGGVVFTAGMTIDADGAPNAYGPHNSGLDYTANARGSHGWVAVVTNQNGRPVTQKSGPYRGYYVSTTSLRQGDIDNLQDPRKYIDATKVPYIALPSEFATRFNVNLGDLAVVTNQANGRSAYAVFADLGPRGRIGEGSIALAKRLGIACNPRHDSVADGVTYLIFPQSGRHAASHISASNIRSSAARLYHGWGGPRRLRALGLAPSTAYSVPPASSGAVEY